MDREKEDQADSFKVTDKRNFTMEGDLRQPLAEEKPAPETPPPDSASRRPPEPERSRPASQRVTPPQGEDPEIDFSSFLFSLATTTLVHLGEIPDPSTNRKHEDLILARQMIDTLGMLQQKTQGNLSFEESGLLENLLYELRMKYVAKSSGAVKL